MTRVLGALCQELGTETKIYFFCYFIAMLSWFMVSSLAKVMTVEPWLDLKFKLGAFTLTHAQVS